MDQMSMDLSELMLGVDDDLALGTLANSFDDEETWLVAPPTASEPHKPRDENDVGEKEDLIEWLEGAVRKVDFRTRSALSRRLEKKKRRREKRERLILSDDSPLSRIDETEGRASQDGLNSGDGLSDEDYDDAYFDAADAAEHIDETRSAGALYRTPNSHRASGRAASLRGGGQCRDTAARTVKDASERLDLSELERRAREQEHELQMELMNRRERLQISSNSRPNSASSSASSSLVLATSRSIDFRTAHGGGSLSMASSIDCGEYNSNLSRLTPTHVSRLPMPRRPVIGGRTGIPLPTPKKTSASGDARSSFRRQVIAPPVATDSALLDADGDCF